MGCCTFDTGCSSEPDQASGPKIMQESNKREPVWHLFSGVVIADLSILLIGLGGWDVLKNETRTLIYVSGIILLLCGLFLIWIEAIKLTSVRHEPILKFDAPVQEAF